jgi:transposase-like protein
LNQQVPNRPSYDQLIEDKKTMPWVAMGKKYGVCDNTIRKWMRAYAAQNQTKDEASSTD